MIDQFLTILLVLEQAADGWLTYAIIKRGGYEQNKWLVTLDQWLHEHVTEARWAWLAWVKFVAIGATWVIYHEYPQALPYLTALYGGVLVHNVIQFVKQRSITK